MFGSKLKKKNYLFNKLLMLKVWLNGYFGFHLIGCCIIMMIQYWLVYYFIDTLNKWYKRYEVDLEEEERMGEGRKHFKMWDDDSKYSLLEQKEEENV